MRKNECLWSMMSCGALLGGSAFAQAAAQDPAPGGLVEEVVVTARKRAENIQETPVSVTAITAQSLADSQIDATVDLQRMTPNLQFSSYAPASGNTELIAQPAYALLNVSARWRSPGGRFTVSGGITNVTDELYRVQGFSSLDTSPAYAESTYARGREWFVGVEFEY